MGSGAMIYMPSFIKTVSDIQKFIRVGGNAHTDTHKDTQTARWFHKLTFVYTHTYFLLKCNFIFHIYSSLLHAVPRHHEAIVYLAKLYIYINIRYKERIHPIRSNNNNSGYLNHIVYTGHTHGAITDNMVITGTGRKGRRLNILEKYHVCRISKDILHMNDIYIYT
jgi:hypothetical protein